MREKRIGYRVALTMVIAGVAGLQGWAQSERPQLYVFSMPNCPPCRQMEPAVDRLLGEGYPVQKIDCQTQPQWANHFQITQTPTVLLVRSGQPVARHVGVLNYAELVGLFHAAGFSPSTTPPAPAAVTGGVATAATVHHPTSTLEAVAPPAGQIPVSASAQAGGHASQPVAYQATIRLKVEDPTGTSYGTGTVIHRYQNAYLAITCGHIFRESRGQGVISVDHGFATGSPRSVRGELLSYDADARDVALVAFESPLEIQPVSLAPQVFPVQADDPVYSLGCNHGADPTLVECQIIRTAVYDGARKYDTTVRPVDGRSGGGLFSAGGQLIGICNAAAVEQDEGIYSSLESIFWQLQQSNLAYLFSPSGTNTSAAAVGPSAPAELALAGSSQPNLPVPAQLDNVGGDELELIVIVRPKASPEQVRTFTVSNPSPGTLAQLEALATQPPLERLADQRAAQSPAGIDGPPPRVIRGQSSR